MEPPKADTTGLRADDLHLWRLEVGRHGRDGPKTYTYWMASWREDWRVEDVRRGSTRRLDAEAAMRKAREMKVEALGIKNIDI